MATAVLSREQVILYCLRQLERESNRDSLAYALLELELQILRMRTAAPAQHSRRPWQSD